MKFIYLKNELYNYGDQTNCAICKEKHYIIEHINSLFRFKCNEGCSEIVFYHDSNLKKYTMTLWRYNLFLRNCCIYISYFNRTYPNVIYIDNILYDNSGDAHSIQYTKPYTDFYNLDSGFFRKIIKQSESYLLLQ